MGSHVPILAYHAILENGRGAIPPQWSRDHAIPLPVFRAQMDILASEGWHTVMPEAVAQEPTRAKCAVITFDDGQSSDLLAARELRQRNLQATFCVTWSRLGSPGFLTRSQVLELDREGFAIGSHGFAHVHFADLAPAELHLQLAVSKQQLECLLGKPVTTVAIPFGSYNERVIAAAVAAGYRAILTSDLALAVPGSCVLPRLVMDPRVTLGAFKQMLSGSAIFIARLRLVWLYRRLMPPLSAAPSWASRALAGHFGHLAR